MSSFSDHSRGGAPLECQVAAAMVVTEVHPIGMVRKSSVCTVDGLPLLLEAHRKFVSGRSWWRARHHPCARSLAGSDLDALSSSRMAGGPSLPVDCHERA